MSPLPSMASLIHRSRTSTVARNILSNYATVIWMSGLSLITVPIYLRNLGAAEWGVVAACITIQNALNMLDIGFGQIMPRSFARAAGNPREELALFHSYSRLYLLLAFLGFLLGEVGAAPAAKYWFHSPGIASDHLRTALFLIPVQFFFQFANNANMGLWNGLQHQRKANLRACTFATARHLTGLSCVLLFSRTAVAYLIPFVLITAMEWGFNRRAALAGYRGIASGETLSGDIRTILRESWTFTVAIIAGILVAQSDRFVLSATQDLTQYGYYIIVANLGLAFMALQGPLFRAFLPRIAREDLHGSGGRATSFRTLFWAVLVVCVLPAVLVIVVAPILLSLWLKNPEIVKAGTLPFRLIVAAVALNSIYNVIYQRLLSLGTGHTVIAINVIGLVAVGLTVLVVGPGIGITLGGVMWLVGCSNQLLLGLLWLRFHRRSALKTG